MPMGVCVLKPVTNIVDKILMLCRCEMNNEVVTELNIEKKIALSYQNTSPFQCRSKDNDDLTTR